MARVDIPHDRIGDGSLPAVCVRCGRVATQRRFPGIAAPSLAWVLVSPLIGLLAFWAYLLLACLFGDRSEAGLPFCERHRRYWPLRAWIIVGGFGILVSLMVVAGILNSMAGPSGPETPPHWMFSVAAVWMLLYLPTFLMLHLTAMRPVKNTATSVTLVRVSPKFVTAVKSLARRRPA